MARSLKLTGLAPDLTFCLAVDDDNLTIKEFVHGWTQGGGGLGGSGPSTGTTTFNGKTVPYIDFSGGVISITVPPTVSSPVTILFIVKSMPDNTGAFLSGDDLRVVGNAGVPGYFILRNLGGTALTYINTPLTIGDSATIALSSHADGNNDQSWVGLDGATISAADNTVSTTDTLTNQNLDMIGGSTGNTSYLGKVITFMVFGRILTTAEVQSIHADFMGAIFASSGANNTIAAPLVTLSLSTFVPTIVATANKVVAAPLATLSLSTFAPTIVATANKTIAVPLVTLSLSPFAPTVIATTNKVIVAPLVTLSLATLAPTIVTTANQVILPPVVALSLSTFAPVLVSTGGNVVQVPLVTLSLATPAPAVIATANQIIAAPVTNIALTTFAPTINSGASNIIAAPLVNISLEVLAPVLVSTAHQRIQVPLTRLAFTVYGPTVTGTFRGGANTRFYEEDVDEFFDDDEFAEEAQYLPLGSTDDPVPIDVIFDAPGTIVLDGVGIESVAPRATCKLADVQDARHGDTLTVRGVSYVVQGYDPDGTGVVVLKLEAPA